MDSQKETYTFTININEKRESLGDLFGLFFEDINRSADGGIYGELIENGAFEFDSMDNKEYTALTAWEKVGAADDVQLTIMNLDSVNNINPHHLKMTVNKADCGVQNIGYNTGISLVQGEKYLFSCYAKVGSNRQSGKSNIIKIKLKGKSGELYGSYNLEISDTWEKYELIIESSHTDHSGRLAIIMPEAGEVYLDFISLFPCNTFKNRRNGMRKDLAQALADMKPKFMRFPGGCLVHCGSLCAKDRNSMYRWKNTLGKVEERPAKSSIWKYHQSLGLGYYEYFQFCEDIGAKPIPIIPAGFDPHNQIGAPIDDMQEWIDEALDLIEFAIGDKNSKWGAIRAKMGHPEPFDLEYLGIGNEEQGEGFFIRYSIIHKAVKEKYPHIKLINSAGPFCEGGDYQRGWESARKEKSDIIDEHYYQSPEWFIANHRRYDNFHEEDPKVFLGEYASQGNTWYNALVEASYMIGLERNAAKVSLASYAPLLANVDYINWRAANLIYFNNHQILLTANYYIQKLFMNHQGDRRLLCTVSGDWVVEDWTKDGDTTGEIYLATNRANVEYTDILIKDSDNKILSKVDYCQLDKDSNELYIGKAECVTYSISFRAKQMSNDGEGFVLHFGRKDHENMMTLSLGGWNKANNTLLEVFNGKGSCLSQYPFPLEIGKTYSVRIDVAGRDIVVTIDGARYQRVTRKRILVEPLYYSSSIEDETGNVILKIVNLTKETRNIDLYLKGNGYYNRCKVFSMYGYPLDAQNEIGKSAVVEPKEIEVPITNNILCYKIEPESFTVFRMSDTNRG